MTKTGPTNYPILHWKQRQGRWRQWLAPWLLRGLTRFGFAELDRYPYLEKPDMGLKAKGHLYDWFLITGHEDLPLVKKVRAFDHARTHGLVLDECARRADP